MFPVNEIMSSRRTHAWLHPFIDHVPYSPLRPAHHRLYSFETRFWDFLTSDERNRTTICDQISLEGKMLSPWYSRSTSSSLWCYCLHILKCVLLDQGIQVWTRNHCRPVMLRTALDRQSRRWYPVCYTTYFIDEIISELVRNI
jgi:hypothetical protein